MEQSRYGYVAFYAGKRTELYADSLYAAHLKAVEHFHPPKSKRHMVSVVLAEVDGEEVTHRAVD